MDEDEQDDTYTLLAQIWNERAGHASSAAHNDNVLKGSKRANELAWGTSWMEESNASMGLGASNLRANSNDPPDLLVSIGGEDYGVEMVEFVQGAVVALRKELGRLAASGVIPEWPDHISSAHPKPPNEQRDAFRLRDEADAQAQWTREKFLVALNACIDHKQKRYAHKRFVADFLVVYSAEPNLFGWQVREWLDGLGFARRPNLNSVHLVLDYEPGQPTGHYPFFCLY